MGRRIRYRPGRVSEQLPAPESAWNDTLLTPQIIVTVGVIWIVVLVVIVLVGYFVMQNRQFQNEFAPLVDVCRNKWVRAASTYSPTPGKHPAVAVRSTSSGWQLDASLIPGDVRASSLAETQVVFCLSSVQEIFIESCPYFDPDHPGVQKEVKRYYNQQEAKLVEAQTGRVITVQTFTGSSPHYCHETEWFREDKYAIKLVGTDISQDEVRRWVSSHLFIE